MQLLALQQTESAASASAAELSGIQVCLFFLKPCGSFVFICTQLARLAEVSVYFEVHLFLTRIFVKYIA